MNGEIAAPSSQKARPIIPTVANFWGRDAKAAREAYFDKFLEHKNWRNNLRFELTNWITFGIGAALSASLA